MKILFCGDLVGRAGRDVVLEHLPALRADMNLDFVVVNAENAAHGFGLTQKICEELFEAGADAPWSLDDRDGDYIAGMIRAIVNFRIPISRIEGKFKLSQNRDGQDRAAVIDALSKSDNPDDRKTAELMRSRE